MPTWSWLGCLNPWIAWVVSFGRLQEGAARHGWLVGLGPTGKTADCLQRNQGETLLVAAPAKKAVPGTMQATHTTVGLFLPFAGVPFLAPETLDGQGVVLGEVPGGTPQAGLLDGRGQRWVFG